MKKSVKIISALLVAIMLIITIAPYALATVDTGIITDIDQKGKGRIKFWREFGTAWSDC